MRHKKALTLFELLVVMIIFSVAVGFVVPLFRIYQKDILRSRIDGDLQLLRAALKVYRLTHSEYPRPENYQEQLWAASPRILEKRLVDPFSETGNLVYEYKTSRDGKFYVAYSVGALGNVRLAVSEKGKVIFLSGDQRHEKWISDGSPE